MELTGKCKDDFLVWYFNSYLKEEKYCLIKDVKRFFENINKLFQNALIIEFFDSVGIYITVNYNFIQAKFTNSVKDKDTILHRGGLYSARQEALTQAIKKTNEIYNSLA